MEKGQISKFPEMKVVDNDLEIEFELELGLSELERNNDCIDPRKQDIQDGIHEVDRDLSANGKRIEELNKEMERLTNSADGLDYALAVGCGIVAAAVDILWVGEFDLEVGEAWSNKKVNEFVMKRAKADGYEGKRLSGAIQHLEDKYPIPTDNLWKGKDIGIFAKSHHLDDLAHHPTPLGLFFSILTQFTMKGYFQNSTGQFLPITIDENGRDLIGNDTPHKFLAGILNWFFHLASDMSSRKKRQVLAWEFPGQSCHC